MNLSTAMPFSTGLALMILAEITFVFSLLFICFIPVSRYAVNRARTGKLVDGVNAPLPIRLPSLTGGFFAFSVLWLLFLQSPLYFLVVPVGLSFYLLESGKNWSEQFGLQRLPAATLAKWILLICGAVIFIEIPLDQIVQIALDATNLPHPEEESVITFRHFHKAGKILAFLLQAVVIAPMFEELFFRGFLQTFLKNYTSTWMALILSSGIFAFAHVNLGAAIQLWFLGLALGIAYEHTGALLLPIGIHGCFNLVTALNLLLDKATS
ncbi:MAG TPA: type II CAAX endopeptidase family protein [Candidatus Methylacidiphilales bacterium]|nr:type II CAAX endopeptidase family protein [Candidatus Methylacidiphilales bacterium]